MYFRSDRMRFSILAVILTLGLSALSKEESHDGGGHEAPKEEKHGEAKKADEPPAWVEVETQISSLEAKLQAKTSALKGLIEQKDHLKENDSQLSKLVKEIGKTDKERRQIAEDLEKQKTILRFRFPERGAAKNRKYQKQEFKSASDLEATIGIDGRLDRSIKKMRGQYGAEEKASKKSHGAEKGEQTPEKPGTIILQK